MYPSAQIVALSRCKSTSPTAVFETDFENLAVDVKALEALIPSQ